MNLCLILRCLVCEYVKICSTLGHNNQVCTSYILKFCAWVEIFVFSDPNILTSDRRIYTNRSCLYLQNLTYFWNLYDIYCICWLQLLALVCLCAKPIFSLSKTTINYSTKGILFVLNIKKIVFLLHGQKISWLSLECTTNFSIAILHFLLFAEFGQFLLKLNVQT